METLRQKLELVLATEPGVIEQYERRKEEVRSSMYLFSTSYPSFLTFPRMAGAQIKSLSRKVEARELQSAKVEKSIKVARVRTPAQSGLDVLTATISPIRITGTLPYKTS